MKKLNNQKIGKISLYSTFGVLILFILIIMIVMPPPDRRDRLLIFDFPSNYSEQDILTFPLDIGSIEYSYPSQDPRFEISTFPMFIILSHDRKEIIFITDKKENLYEYYKNDG